MSAQLNHTIVWCHDKQRSAVFLTEILLLPLPTQFGPFLVIQLNNGVSLDYHEIDGEIFSQHYAFLISDDEFEQVFSRIRSQKLQYWADPGKHRMGEINFNDGGKGVYFEDPNGHLLEVITRPYGSGL